MQARSGSTRLSNEMNLKFCEESFILDILISRLKMFFQYH